MYAEILNIDYKETRLKINVRDPSETIINQVQFYYHSFKLKTLNNSLF